MDDPEFQPSWQHITRRYIVTDQTEAALRTAKSTFKAINTSFFKLKMDLPIRPSLRIPPRAKLPKDMTDEEVEKTYIKVKELAKLLCRTISQLPCDIGSIVNKWKVTEDQRLQSLLQSCHYHGLDQGWDVLVFLRALAYRRANVECPPLPKRLRAYWSAQNFSVRERLTIAHRIVFITEMAAQHGGARIYDGRYYAPRVSLSCDDLKARLEPRHHWLLRPRMPVAFEWGLFVYYVSQLGIRRPNYVLAMIQFPSVCAKYRVPLNAVPMDACTTPATNTSESQCHICMEPFVDEDPPVQTLCNHVMGKACLSVWLENHNSCPVCRQSMVSDIDRLPRKLFKIAKKVWEHLDYLKSLDPIIDHYLIGGVREVNDLGFHKLLGELIEIGEALYRDWMKMWRRLATMQPLSARLGHFMHRVLVDLVEHSERREMSSQDFDHLEQAALALF